MTYVASTLRPKNGHTRENLREVWDKIHSFETMTAHEIYGKGRHEVLRTALHRTARKRLEEIGLDETEEFVSMRLTG